LGEGEEKKKGGVYVPRQATRDILEGQGKKGEGCGKEIYKNEED